MFSTPPHPSGATTKTTARHQLATNAFRTAGLLEDDAKMSDQARPQSKAPSQTTLRERTTGPRPPRQRIYERPKAAEKDKNGKLPHPNAARIAAKTAVGSAVSIRGTASSSAPPQQPANRSREIGKVDAAAASAQNKTKGSNIAVLRTFIERRWNPETRFLNLEKLAEDSIWVQHRMVPPDHDRAPKDIGAVLLKLASQLTPAVETLSFANNNFRDLRQFSTLHHYLPNLHNLSFENNNIRSSKEIHQISSRKDDQPSQLREINLLNNHCRDAALQGGTIETYRGHVLRKFPNLSVLDKEPVTRIGFDVPALEQSASSAPDTEAAKEFTNEMGPPIVVEGVTPLALEFLKKFFAHFDNSRSALADAYVPNATFSFAANTAAPPRARIRGHNHSQEMPHQRKLEWSVWLEAGSRNLTRVNTIEKTTRSLHSTVEDIIKALGALPATKHNLNDDSRFLVDAWPISGVLGETTLFVTVHGQFAELPSLGVRSFDRSFMLAAAAEGSRARQNGWPCVILSDQLVVRSYSSHEAWKPGKLFVQVDPNSAPAAKAPSSPLHPDLLKIPESQRPLVLQVQQQTGLNIKFSIDCLNGNGWDLQRALANFQELRASIPPEAFIP